MKKISIISPTYNEEENILELYKKIAEQISLFPQYIFEILFIDNASTDNTQKIINKLCLEDKKIKAIFNTKNFGHIRSPFHAILQSKGDAIILVAADFQDPPILIPQLIEKWSEGSDIVLLKRKKTQENIFLEFVKKLF